MKFAPKSEKECSELGLLPDGIYDFEIVDATDEISKNSGNEMIKLAVRVFDQEGNSRNVIYDYLLESVAYKLRHAAEACGLIDSYEMGQLTADDFIGKTGKVKIITQKDKTGQYPDKNGIKDYVVGAVPQSQARRSAPQKAMADVDDEIPF